MKFTFVALLSFIIFFSGCKDESTLLKPPDEIEPSTEIKISHLSHTSAREGEKIVVYGKNFNRYIQSYAQLNGIYTASNRTSDSTMSLIIPRNAQNGRFDLHFWSTEHDTVLYSPGFYIEQICTSGFCIGWNTKERIVKSDSWIGKFIDSTFIWQIMSSSDTLFLRRTGYCGRECSFTQEIAFKTGNLIGLPELLYALYTQLDIMAGQNIVDTMRTGVVRIDVWNQTLKSGSFVTEDHNWIFWSEL